MNKECSAKLNYLKDLAFCERKSAAMSLKATLAVYALLVLAVFAWTTYVAMQIRELAKPEEVSILLADRAKEQLVSLRSAIRNKSPEASRQIANAAFEQVMNVIPQLEMVATEYLDDLADKLVEEYEGKYFPPVYEFIEQGIDDILANKDIVQDEKTATALAQELVHKCDMEMTRIYEESFVDNVRKLTAELRAIATVPPEKRTRRQEAERKVIVYWYEIARRPSATGADGSGHNFFAEFVRSLDAAARSYAAAFSKACGKASKGDE